jgi:hypothetical protein
LRTAALDTSISGDAGSPEKTIQPAGSHIVRSLPAVCHAGAGEGQSPPRPERGCYFFFATFFAGAFFATFFGALQVAIVFPPFTLR